jgi:hypothetical protein
VSSTLGSLTSTRWKRRESARSFSKCCRYSLNVVEPGQGRLEQVARVHAAARRGAGSDDGVDLVDEEDGLVELLQGLDDGLDSLLEVAPEARAREQRAHVERVHGGALERLGDLVPLDLEGEPLGDGGLADARVAHEQRVVLLAAREDLHDARDLVLPPDEGIDALGEGLFVQVGGVGLERILGRACARALFARLGPFAAAGGDLLVVHLGHAVRDVRDQIEPRDPQLFHERHGVRVALGEHRDQHVGARHLFLAARLHVGGGAADGPLHPERGRGVGLVVLG